MKRKRAYGSIRRAMLLFLMGVMLLTSLGTERFPMVQAAETKTLQTVEEKAAQGTEGKTAHGTEEAQTGEEEKVHGNEGESVHGSEEENVHGSEGERVPGTEEEGPPKDKEEKAAGSEEERSPGDEEERMEGQEPSQAFEKELPLESEEGFEELNKEEPENSAAEEPERLIQISGKGEHLTYRMDQESGAYEPGSPVTVFLIPEEGYAVDESSIVLTEAEGSLMEFQKELQTEGTVKLTFLAAEQDMQIGAEAKVRRRVRIICHDEGGNISAHLSGSTAPDILYEGVEARVLVSNTGGGIWEAEVMAEGRELVFEMSEDSVLFTMPDANVMVTLYEMEGTDHENLSGDDSNISGDFQGNQSLTKKDHEPDVELGKAARWTDIEDGYAELTITEKDTSDYSNIPVDYIFILDRTRTMSLNESTVEGGSGAVSYMMQNSPCINPDHYYHKGGVSLWLKDYYTGYDWTTGIWYENLRADAKFWNRHYNSSGQKIMPTYENGCYDRLTMAKQAINELVDSVAAQNAAVPAGAAKSRIAFWSFGSEYKDITGDNRDKGLYNYVGLTTDYNQIKNAVNAVKTYSGTYYLASLEEAYRILTNRNATDPLRKDIYTKVVFLSDGECTDQVNESKAVADQIKALPNTELFTLAIGMTADSDGTKLLRELASSDAHTANFWQNLSFSGGKGSALAQTLFTIDEKAAEVKAVNKVLTDQIETKYWEPVEVIRADGGISSVSLNPNTGVLRWNVPEGAGRTYTCTVKLKLKDAYRYLLSDTSYPTNRDAAGATMADIEANPTKAGAVLDYNISGGIYHTQSRKVGVITPNLKYGTVQFEGEKNWTVEGSQAESVTVRLMRTLPSQTTAVQVNNAITNITRKWGYTFTMRAMPDGSTKPLIKYDELGRTVKYEVTESVPAYYHNLNSIVTNKAANANNGVIIHTQLYNEPFKVKAQIKKVDEDTKNPLSGAIFTVYAWSEKVRKYVPYKGTTNIETINTETANTGARPYETGTMTGAANAMTLTEGAKGIYTTPSWLYYSPDNHGRFRIVETLAPAGYFGDWKDDSAVTENSSDADKRVYDVIISSDAAQNQSTITISNNNEGTFEDQRVLGKITFEKKDLEAKDTIAQGDATLVGATYHLYAAEEIVHQDGSTGVLYHKDEEVKVRLMSNVGGVNTYRYDPNGSDTLTVGTKIQIVIEDLEIGNYYLKEETSSEGYLVDPNTYPFEIVYQGEKTAVAEVADYAVYEQVKKQALSFYKVTGTDNTDQLDPMKGAKFSVYLLSEIENGKYTELTDEEVPQAIIDDFRNPATLGYEALKAYQPATVYAEADHEDVVSGRLTKEVRYSDSIVYRAASGNANAYLAAELESDRKGVVTTPGLPYGRYLVVETTTPKNTIATRPFVVTVQADDEDGIVDGDGQGMPLDDLVILMDRPVMSLIRIEKQDSKSRAIVLKPGASYVIHDTDGVWYDYYTKEMTSVQKAAYKEKYGDLVVQYSQGENLGTKENPFITKLISAAEDQRANVYIETPSELPSGTYELEEISAPEGYVLQGQEGVIAKSAASMAANRTFYETEETGRWEDAPQGRTKFVVSYSEAVYDEDAGTFVIAVKQQNDPAIGKIAVYAKGEYLVSAKQEGSTIFSRLADKLQGFFGSVFGWISLDTPDDAGMTLAELENYKDYVFTYEMGPVEGAQFEIRAAEDIYSPEGGANAVKLFEAGELVVTLTTDTEGQTWTGQEDWPGTDIAKGLPLGKYTVTQTKAGYGFALSKENAKPREIEIAYAGQEVPVIYRDTAYTNPRQQVQIEVEKRDGDSDTLLSGAVFGLYAKENIQNYKGKTVVKAGTLVAIAETSVNEEGQVTNAVFEPDLPLAGYYIKELRPPFGYTTYKQSIAVDAAYKEDQRETITVEETVRNVPVKVQINLMDYFTEVELDGAQLTAVDEEGNLFTTILSAHENNEIILGLEIHKTYTVKELVSPEGYHYRLYRKDGYVTSKKDAVELDKEYPSGKADDSVSFTVQDEEALQVVSVFNKPMLGELTIRKTGEEVTGSTTGTDENGNVLETPVYEIKGLPGAEYVLRAKGDIVYPDGYSGKLFQKGEVILDRYAELKNDGLFRNYRMEIAENTGSLTDVSDYLGVKYGADATDEEILAFYETHGSDVERQIPSAKEITENRTSFQGTPVSYVLKTNEEGLVRITGLPLGEYEVIEVKAPEGYYRDKETCVQDLTVAVPEEEGGRPDVEDNRPEAVVSVKINFENARQQVPKPEEPEQPKPTMAVYHPSIRITKDADKEVYDPGEIVTYRIVVINNGDVDLTNVRVTDSLAGGQIRKIDYLAVNEPYAFDYPYQVPKDAQAGSRIDNMVHVVGTPEIPEPGIDENGLPVTVDPSSYMEPEDSDIEKVFVRGAEILVKKVAQQRMYAPGDLAVYEIEVLNPNAYDLKDVKVTDSLGGTFRTVSEQGAVQIQADGTVSLELLPAGGKANLIYEYQIPEDAKAGQMENLVIAAGTSTDPGYKRPAIQVEKSAQKQVYRPGETVVYTILVTNTGERDLKDVKVEDNLGGTWMDDPVIGNLAVGESVSLTYEYVVPEGTAPGTSIKNVAIAAGTTIPHPEHPEDDPKRPVKDMDEEEILVVNENTPAISLKKSVDKRVVKPGEMVTYTLLITNTGNVDLKEVEVTDSNVVLDAEVSRIGVLRVGESKTIRYLYTVPETAVGGEKIPNTAVVTGMEELPPDSMEEPRKVTDSDKEEIRVETGKTVEDEDDEIILVQNPGISIIKNVEKQVYDPGETAHYTIHVTNTGDCSLVDVTVEEHLLTEGHFTGTTKGTFDGCQAMIGQLAVGETVTLTFAYTMPEDAEAGKMIYNIVSTKGTSEPVKDPVIPEMPDGTPNYLPTKTVTDSDEQEIYVQELAAGLMVTKYSVDEGARIRQAGAAFTLYAAEDVKNIHGTVIYAAGQELETAISGENGIAVFKLDVPVGRYQVKETKAPSGHYSTDKKVEFQVDQSKYNDNVQYLSFTDYVENAITVVNFKLVDDMTGNELAGASLQVTDSKGKPVEAWTTKVSDGYVVKGLNTDTEYTIHHVVPREGYLADLTAASITSPNACLIDPKGQQVTFMIGDVTTGTTEEGKIDKITIPEITRIILEAPFVVGQVRMDKDGELLDSWNLQDKFAAFVKSIFHYEKKPLEGVTFTIYAKEDIEHPDGITGIVFHGGDVVAAGVRSLQDLAIGRTDSQGIVSFEEMYLGQYEILESAAAEGFVRDAEPKNFTLAYVDAYTSPVEAEDGSISWINNRQKARITIVKQDAKTGEQLAGAVFGLYNKEEILNYQGNTLIPAETLLELAKTDADGQITFQSDLPKGDYFIKEETAPKGYVKEDRIWEVPLKKKASDKMDRNTEKSNTVGSSEIGSSKTGGGEEIAEVKFIIENQPKEVIIIPSDPGNSSVPQRTEAVRTGDAAHIGWYLGLFGITAAACLVIWIWNRRKW